MWFVFVERRYHVTSSRDRFKPRIRRSRFAGDLRDSGQQGFKEKISVDAVIQAKSRLLNLRCTRRVPGTDDGCVIYLMITFQWKGAKVAFWMAHSIDLPVGSNRFQRLSPVFANIDPVHKDTTCRRLLDMATRQLQSDRPQ
jgi:hypothetical protein